VTTEEKPKKYIYKNIRCLKCYKPAKEEDGIVHDDEIHFLCTRCGSEYIAQKTIRYALWKKTAPILGKEENFPLNQCPFCSGEAALVKENGVYFVMCPKCHAHGGTAKMDNVAVKYWNQRLGGV
jgi:Zn finger protein HypA/HybF involved in hydrogenase expression